MKIEDCYVGQTVKHNYTDMYLDIEEGDKGTIEEINKKDNYIVVWRKQFDPSNFSASDRFNIDDEVIYKSFDSETIKSREKAVIFGIAPKRDKFKKEYAISYIHEGPYGKKKRVNKIVAEHDLLPLKKKDELEVGEPVDFRYYDGTHYKAEIWGIADKKDDVDWIKYGISFIKKGYHRVAVVREDRLSPLKKKDELKVGDKVVYGTAKYKILCVGIDDYYKHKEYYCKRIDENFKGVTTIIKPNAIDEIIYE